jgi:hypothetical protein
LAGLLFICLLLGADWEIKQTGVFMPLLTYQVTSSPDNHFFILDAKEYSILHFGSDAKLLGRIGRRGLGPGELRGPIRIFFREPYLYVRDYRRLVVFDKASNHIRDIQLPEEGNVLTAPLVNGFVYRSSESFFRESDDTFKLTWTDEGFSQFETLHAWQIPPPAKGVALRRQKVTYSREKTGIGGRSYVVASQDGKTIAFKERDTTKVLFFDAESRSLFKTLELGLENIETFISRMVLGPEGLLWVSRNEENKPGPSPILFFTMRGEPATSDISNEARSRTIKISEGWAYVLTFDEGVAEVGVARCKREELNQFVASRPYTSF